MWSSGRRAEQTRRAIHDWALGRRDSPTWRRDQLETAWDRSPSPEPIGRRGPLASLISALQTDGRERFGSVDPDRADSRGHPGAHVAAAAWNPSRISSVANDGWLKGVHVRGCGRSQK
jgi:hypothetical protein